MISISLNQIRIWSVLALVSGTIQTGFSQRLVSRYAIDFLRGYGTYTMINGNSGQGDLQFKTRGESVLYIDRKHQFAASAIKSFTINEHTLVPQGVFDFQFGFHSYHAENAFIEYADTTGTLQLAVYYTAEPTGDMTTYFTTFLLRQKGSQVFLIGPNNNKNWRKAERQAIGALFAQWPDMQKSVLSGEVTFENLPDYVRRVNEQSK